MTTTTKIVIAAGAALGLYWLAMRNAGQPGRPLPGNLPSPAPAKPQPQAKDMAPRQITYVQGANSGSIGPDQILAGGAAVGDLLDRFGIFGGGVDE